MAEFYGDPSRISNQPRTQSPSRLASPEKENNLSFNPN